MIEYIDRGVAPYRTVWDEQTALFNSMIADKRAGKMPESETVIMVEHLPVYTMGRHANPANVLMSEQWLQANNVEVIPIERGGDITFHGPGQLVVYPILDLQQHNIGIRQYVEILEEAVIQTIAHYGIKGERVEGATGVWIGAGTPGERKICAIGVRCSRSVTMHGLALNVSTDLSYFSKINPCGFIDKGVTSICQETGKKITVEEVAATMKPILTALLNR